MREETPAVRDTLNLAAVREETLTQKNLCRRNYYRRHLRPPNAKKAAEGKRFLQLHVPSEPSFPVPLKVYRRDAADENQFGELGSEHH